MTHVVTLITVGAAQAAGQAGAARDRALTGPSNEDVYRFGPFTLHVGGRSLRVDGAAVPLGGRAFEVLVALVRRAGELVSKATLLDEVWPNVNVIEHNIPAQISQVRRALAAHDPSGFYIDTDASRGYRFVGKLRCPDPVTLAAPPPPAMPAPAPSFPEPPAVAAAPSLPDRHNLPAEPNSFVGRAAELAEIDTRLLARQLLTLVGSGGVGKTRCALRVGHAQRGAFADGVWIVELAPLQDEKLVAEALCRVIGAPVSGDRPAVEVATHFLRQRQMFVILDNCEHVLGAVAQLAASLLQHCPAVKLLATSREKLNIAGESVYRMPSLPLPSKRGAITAAAALESDAVRLFVDRAGDATGHYELTDADAPAVVTICRRLDGVAMATELAAARLRILKPAEIAARLEDVFRLLTGGSKAVLPRQQTLRATIDWSFALLSPAEQTLLSRLSVFVDGFSPDGATAVGGGGWIDPADVLDLLTALVDKSLVGVDTTGAVTRYRMLTTTRHYAHEKLVASGEIGHFRRLADYLAAFYARGEKSWGTTPTDVWLAQYGPDVENLRAAIDWAFGETSGSAEGGDGACDPALGIALVAAAGSVAEETSLLADMKRWTAAAMPHLSKTIPLDQAGWVLYWLTRHQSVFGVAELSDMRRQAIALFREAGDVVGLSCALRTAGIAMTRPGEKSAEALDMLTEAVALLRPLGETKDLATAIAHLGSYHYYDGDDDLGRRLTEEALSIRLRLGDKTGKIVSHINLAEFAFARGDTAEAIDYVMQALGAARNCPVQEVLATLLANLANYLLSTNEIVQGRAAAEEALAICQALGTEDYAVGCLENLALAMLLEGASEPAARLFGYTEAHFCRTAQVRDRSDQIRCDRFRFELAARICGQAATALMAEGARWGQEKAISTALSRTAESVVQEKLIAPALLN